MYRLSDKEKQIILKGTQEEVELLKLIHSATRVSE